MVCKDPTNLNLLEETLKHTERERLGHANNCETTTIKSVQQQPSREVRNGQPCRFVKVDLGQQIGRCVHERYLPFSVYFSVLWSSLVVLWFFSPSVCCGLLTVFWLRWKRLNLKPNGQPEAKPQPKPSRSLV